MRLSVVSLVLALLFQDLIGFYLEQFNAIWSTLFHLVPLIGLLAYLPGIQRTASDETAAA